MRTADERSGITDRDFLVLVPAFLASELRRAFEIGFLLFIPFLVVDLVVSNLLLALGMHMLSPTTVSLPFKLLLFVLADGWQLMLRGLVESYV
jgi:type III secretion protein R